MAKIIRPNLVNTVRSSEISAMLRWGALFAVLLAGAAGLLLAKQYLPAAVCILILPIALPLAKKQIGVIRAGADGEAETLRLLRKLPADWTVIPDAVIEYRGHRSQTDYILIAPTGVLILEAKNVSGKVTGRAENRELSQYKPSRGGRPAEQKRMYNPLLQVKGHQTTLQNILRAAGLSVPVRTAVYFANPNAEVHIDGAVNVFTVHDSQSLDQSMRRLLGNGEKVDTAAVIRAVKQSFSK